MSRPLRLELAGAILGINKTGVRTQLFLILAKTVI